MNDQPTNPADFEIIHAYSRADAITDGELVEADPELLANAGIALPLVYTRAVHASCVAWDDEAAQRTGAPQDARGREWDLVWAVSRAFSSARSDESQITCTYLRIDPDDPSTDPSTVTVIAHCGPGDSGEPVLTVMFPGED